MKRHSKSLLGLITILLGVSTLFFVGCEAAKQVEPSDKWDCRTVNFRASIWACKSPATGACYLVAYQGGVAQVDAKECQIP
jgi:hypothetical protein